jgi:RNA polymerase primary sigma factor
MNTKSNAVKSYMSAIASIPLVNQQEEVELAAKIAKGDQNAIEKLTISNLRLVVKIAHDYKNLGIPLGDLIAEGNIGLMKAVVKFEPEKGAKFSSYAAWWIKQAIRRAIANQSRMIRVPIQAATKIRLIRETCRDLEKANGESATPELVSRTLGLNLKSVRRLMATSKSSMISMDMNLKDGEAGTVGDVLPDLRSSNPEELLNERDVLKLLKEIIDNNLNDREKLIINMRYGFDDGKPKTLDEVSTLIGRTRERVRQIQYQALKKLKNCFSKAKLTELSSFGLSLN